MALAELRGLPRHTDAVRHAEGAVLPVILKC